MITAKEALSLSRKIDMQAEELAWVESEIKKAAEKGLESTSMDKLYKQTIDTLTNLGYKLLIVNYPGSCSHTVYWGDKFPYE